MQFSLAIYIMLSIAINMQLKLHCMDSECQPAARNIYRSTVHVYCSLYTAYAALLYNID